MGMATRYNSQPQSEQEFLEMLSVFDDSSKRGEQWTASAQSEAYEPRSDGVNAGWQHMNLLEDGSAQRPAAVSGRVSAPIATHATLDSSSETLRTKVASLDLPSRQENHDLQAFDWSAKQQTPGNDPNKCETNSQRWETEHYQQKVGQRAASFGVARPSSDPWTAGDIRMLACPPRMLFFNRGMTTPSNYEPSSSLDHIKLMKGHHEKPVGPEKQMSRWGVAATNGTGSITGRREATSEDSLTTTCASHAFASSWGDDLVSFEGRLGSYPPLPSNVTDETASSLPAKTIGASPTSPLSKSPRAHSTCFSPGAQKKRRKNEQRPLRPLSAYNFFYRDERDRIVLRHERHDFSEEQQDRLLQDHWQQVRTKRRRHRRTMSDTHPNKMDLHEMSRVISQRWKNLNGKERDFYHNVAARDMQRYQKEAREFRQHQQSIAKAATEPNALPYLAAPTDD